MTTKAECLKLAKAKHPYAKGIFIRENRNAATREEREVGSARRRACVARRKEINAELVSLPEHRIALTKAARFVVDVDGDNPSIPELAKILAIAERAVALQTEHRELCQEQDSIDCFSYRWSVADPHGFATCIHEQADTLEELATNLKPKEPASVQ